MSNESFVNSTAHQRDHYNTLEKSLILVSMTAMSLFSIFGNVLVFVAYFKVKTLQRATNYLILSLAGADFIVATFVVNIHTMYMVIKWPYSVLNYSYCLLWLTIDYWVFQVSVFGVLLIAGDRYLSIKFPHGYRRRRTDGRIKIAILVTWIVSFLIWVPLILGYAFNEGVEEEMISKGLCDVGSAKVIPATVIGCCVSYILPVIIVGFFAVDSVHILLRMKTSMVRKKPMNESQGMVFMNPYVQNASKGVKNIDHEARSPTSTSLKQRCQSVPEMAANKPEVAPQRTLSLSAEVKTKKVSRIRLPSSVIRLSDYQWIATFNVLLAVSFLINILPFGVLAVTRSVCLHLSGRSCVSTEWWYFGYIMCYLNSMLNPLCYAFGNKNFKRAFRMILCERRRKNSVPTLTITEDSIVPISNNNFVVETDAVSLASIQIDSNTESR